MNIVQWNKAAEKYVSYLRNTHKAGRTIRKYSSDINAFIRYAKTIRQNPMQAYPAYAGLLRSKYKASTYNSYVISINMFLRYLGLTDCIQPLLKIQKRFSLDHELSKDEYNLLLCCLQRIGDTKYYMIARTLAGTGIRVGELMFITRETVEKGWGEISFKGKVRQIFIPLHLRQELTEYVNRMYIENGAVFLGRNSAAPVNPSTVWRHFKKAAVLAGVDERRVYPHNLRHLFARVYMERYGDIVDLADILGHSSIETTRIYARTSYAEKIRRISELGL
jgi:integrase